MKGTIFSILLVFLFIPAWAQVERKEIRSGNSAYEKGNYQKAEIDYRRALVRNPKSIQAKYNLGNALYKLNNSPEAEKVISPLVDSIINPNIKSNAYHNIGNFNLAQKKYQESIDSYKNSLRIHPNDMETKANLAYAQKMLKDQKDKQNKDKDKNKDQNKDNKDNKDKNKDQKQDQKNNNDKKDGQQPPPKITPQAAQQMLQAIQNKEKETQDKVNKEKAKVLETRQRDKNW
jgi:Ca-activated chloride channel homolog